MFDQYDQVFLNNLSIHLENVKELIFIIIEEKNIPIIINNASEKL